MYETLSVSIYDLKQRIR